MNWSIDAISNSGWEYRVACSLLVSSVVTLLLWLTFRCGQVRASLPPALRFWIWWIVCLRFALALAPLPSIEIALTLPAAHWLNNPAARISHVYPSASSYQFAPAQIASPQLVNSGRADTLPPPTATASVPNMAPLPPPLPMKQDLPAKRIPYGLILLLVWLCGMAMRMTASTMTTRRIRALIRTAWVVTDTIAVGMLSEVWNASNPPRLLQHASAAGPFAAQWGTSAILLPDWLLDESPELLRSVLAHEVRHLRRRDVWLSLVPLVCQTAFWWLPAASVAAGECARCAEEDCDQAAIRGAASESARSYAELLIRIGRRSPGASNPLGASSLSANYSALRLRLLAMTSAARPAPLSRPIVALAAAACCLAASIPSILPTISAAASIIANAATANQAAPLYELVDLGEPNASGSAAESIADSGDIVGYETLPGKPGLHGYLWRDGRAQPLPANLGYKSTRAVAVNARGDLALSAFGLLKYQHAALVSRSGGVTALETPRPFRYAAAVALNDAQDAAGYVYSGEKFGKLQARAVVWNQGKATDLGTLGGSSSEAFGLNPQGDVVGKADLAHGLTHAFIATASSHAPVDLGALTGGGNSAAYAINRGSMIVGYSATDNPLIQHAVLWYGNRPQPIDLGGLVAGGISKARSINDHDEIVGVSTNPGGSRARATLWRGGNIYDLNACLASEAPGWTLRYAVGINNNGQIVGVGQRSGQTHAFLLQPAARRPIRAPAHLP